MTKNLQDVLQRGIDEGLLEVEGLRRGKIRNETNFTFSASTDRKIAPGDQIRDLVKHLPVWADQLKELGRQTEKAREILMEGLAELQKMGISGFNFRDLADALKVEVRKIYPPNQLQPITETDFNSVGYYFIGTYKEGSAFKAFTQVPTGVANRYTTHLMESVDDGLTWRDDPNMQIVTNENYYLTKSIPISGGSRMLTGYTQFYINKNFGF